MEAWLCRNLKNNNNKNVAQIQKWQNYKTTTGNVKYNNTNLSILCSSQAPPAVAPPCFGCYWSLLGSAHYFLRMECSGEGVSSAPLPECVVGWCWQCYEGENTLGVLYRSCFLKGIAVCFEEECCREVTGPSR